jgi:AraC-like DNA-binding protein
MTDWLFSSGNCQLSHVFDGSERVNFRAGNRKAYLEESPVLPGIWLYRGEATARSRFGMAVDGGERGQGRIILGSVLSSRGVVNLEGCDDQVWRDDGRFYVLTPIERRTSYQVDAENGWRVVAVRLEAEALELLAGDKDLPDLARQALEARLDDFSGMAPLSGPLRSLSHSLLRSPYEGPMQKLFRQAKVLELLAHQFAAFGGVGDRPMLSAVELAKVRMVRDRLVADMQNPPGLDALARDVGLSAKRLNSGFRELYGTTVFNYLRDARLDAARVALEAGTPLPLKHLAWELGYNQVTNFVTAFRRRFGVTPGSYRADGKGDYDRRQ